MGKKTLSFGEGIIATHTSDINGDRADERPVGSGVVVRKGSGIFSEKHIFDDNANDFQSPNALESKSANSSAEVTKELM